ncbi:MAG: hypothetical protein P8J85_10410 [Alphaproteobacteria bacterium]|nr:hypothetical protein [Alphaproteobacteria bacterium]MDG1887610.1 hypothetical protein [Alphaproteobacteria bacterium]
MMDPANAEKNKDGGICRSRGRTMTASRQVRAVQQYAQFLRHI